MSVHPIPADARPLAAVLRQVRKTFGGSEILKGFDLQIARGEFVALLGASGSGKSTVLRILLGLEPASSGEVLAARRSTVVFQDARLVKNLRALDNVLIGQPRDAAHREAALAALSEVGLDHRVSAWPATLSGGEAQRVALARALVRQPELLLLDEPFAALDALTRIRMHQLVAALCQRHGPGVLLVTHDVDEAILLADRILVLRDGVIASDIAGLERGHDRRSDRFAQLRQRLLGELGVSEAPGA